MRKDIVYLLAQPHTGMLTYKDGSTGEQVDVLPILPAGCEGILFAFKTKTAARQFAGRKSAPLIEAVQRPMA